MAKAAPAGSPIWDLVRKLMTGKTLSVTGAITGLAFLTLHISGVTWEVSKVFDRVDRRLERMEQVQDIAAKQAAVDRENAQTKQQAFIDCLQNERKNPKTFRCAMDTPPKVAVMPEAPARKAAPKKVQEANWFSWLGLPAAAGSSK